MHKIIALNVNDALPKALKAIRSHNWGREARPRGMKVREFVGPVVTQYINPKQCVLIDTVRLANPFFHLFEALWILAGRNDVIIPDFFNRGIRHYSDDGKTFYGAYGRRLRGMDVASVHHAESNDQLLRVMTMLEEDPHTRRAVASIWRKEDLYANSKDIPCNDLVIFTQREGKLDLTVMNRSNDVIWGAYGANAVQFGLLLWYMADAMGLAVGSYYQVSNNLHVYTEDESAGLYHKLSRNWLDGTHAPYIHTSGVHTFHRFVKDRKTFDKENTDLLSKLALYGWSMQIPDNMSEPFLRDVARPMLELWIAHKKWVAGKGTSTFEAVNTDGFDFTIDWLHAARQWLQIKEGINDKQDV